MRGRRALAKRKIQHDGVKGSVSLMVIMSQGELKSSEEFSSSFSSGNPSLSRDASSPLYEDTYVVAIDPTVKLRDLKDLLFGTVISLRSENQDDYDFYSSTEPSSKMTDLEQQFFISCKSYNNAIYDTDILYEIYLIRCELVDVSSGHDDKTTDEDCPQGHRDDDGRDNVKSSPSLTTFTQKSMWNYLSICGGIMDDGDPIYSVECVGSGDIVNWKSINVIKDEEEQIDTPGSLNSVLQRPFVFDSPYLRIPEDDEFSFEESDESKTMSEGNCERSGELSPSRRRSGISSGVTSGSSQRREKFVASKMFGESKEDLIKVFLSSEPNSKYENQGIFIFTPLVYRVDGEIKPAVPITNNFRESSYINSIAHIPGYMRNTESFQKAKCALKYYRKEMIKHPALHTLKKPTIAIPVAEGKSSVLLYLVLTLPFDADPIGFTFDENDTPNTILTRVFKNPVILSIFKEKGLSTFPADYALRERDTFNYYYTDERFIEFDEIRKYFASDRDPTLDDAVPLLLVSNLDVPVVSRNTVSKAEYVKRIDQMMEDSLKPIKIKERQLNHYAQHVPGYLCSSASVVPMEVTIRRIPTANLLYSQLYGICAVYTKVYARVNDVDIIKPKCSPIILIRDTNEVLGVSFDKVETHMCVNLGVRNGVFPVNTMFRIELHQIESTEDAILTFSNHKNCSIESYPQKMRQELLNRSHLVSSTKISLTDLREKPVTRGGFAISIERKLELCNQADFTLAPPPKALRKVESPSDTVISIRLDHGGTDSVDIPPLMGVPKTVSEKVTTPPNGFSSNFSVDDEEEDVEPLSMKMLMNNTLVVEPGVVCECDRIVYKELWTNQQKLRLEGSCLSEATEMSPPGSARAAQTKTDSCDKAKPNPDSVVMMEITKIDVEEKRKTVEEKLSNGEEAKKKIDDSGGDGDECRKTEDKKQDDGEDCESDETTDEDNNSTHLYDPLIPRECVGRGKSLMVNDQLSFNPVQDIHTDEGQTIYYNRHELLKRPFGIPTMLKVVSPFSRNALAAISLIIQYPIKIHPVTAVVMLRFSVGLIGREIQRAAIRSLAELDEDHFKLILPQLIEVLKYTPIDGDMLYMKFLLTKCYEEPMKIGIPMFYVLLSSAEYDDDEVRKLPLMLLIEELFLLTKRTYKVNGVSQYTRLTDAHSFYMRLIKVAKIIRENMPLLNQLEKQFVDPKTKKKQKNFAALHELLNTYICGYEGTTAKERMAMNDKEIQAYPFITEPPKNPEDSKPIDFPVIDLVRPNSLVVDVDLERCKFFDSAKAPLSIWSRNGRGMLVKSGDDMRQDELTLHILTVINEIWTNAKLRPLLKLYKVANIGRMAGVCEMVGKSKTLAFISRREGGGISGAFHKKPLYRFLQKHNRTPQSLTQAVSNFVRSCASYSVSMYVLGIGDRHNDNIMLSEDGVLFHIDFGHFLGNYKTFLGFKRESAPFNLTPDMAYVMGGKKSAKFAEFVDLCKKMYVELRKHERVLTGLFEVMCTAGIPELKKVEDAWWIRDALSLDLTEEAAAKSFEEKIYVSLDTKRTQVNNFIHLAVH